ncbi:hypothetical protein DVY93_06225 [Psychrobacter sp. CCUG 69069]|uniref:hypothetical protein n=1 Tax=Psychrobacter sp. CCUG 69069 TaxID=2282777 RepID=UPI001E341064|nr:hypothetical protein [Psychrobacter sp. CCUG 69069]MCD1279355.1 hypothetical protein [Psychrobacter sp. CCUG 69069]|tara:strand:+ start:471 stop:1070 length:600 start_codon:yes stop_codon:yes gene_type:complete
MLALSRTHSTTALLCLSFLIVSAGCQQQADEPKPSSAAVALDSTAEASHDEHTHDAHADHDEHSHEEHAHSHGEHSHGEHGHEGNHEGHNHDATDMTTYACQPEQTIKAHYDPENNAQSATSAHLLIEGIEYDLTAMTLPQTDRAGAVYETDIGITNDAGMRWQVNADTTRAILSNKTLDGSVAKDAETVLFDCQKTDS